MVHQSIQLPSHSFSRSLNSPPFHSRKYPANRYRSRVHKNRASELVGTDFTVSQPFIGIDMWH